MLFVLDTNGDNIYEPGVDAVFHFGLAGDQIVIGDWNGDGRTKIGVERPDGEGSLLFVLDTNGDGVFDSGVDAVYHFGRTGDQVLIGDWTGSGTTKIGVERPDGHGSLVFDLDTNGNGVFDPGVDVEYHYGLTGDQVIVGDWNGDGRTKIGVVRPDGVGSNLFILDTNGNGVFDSSADATAHFGLPTDRLLLGDWTGDGITKLGVSRPGRSRANRSPTWTSTATASSKPAWIPSCTLGCRPMWCS